MRLVETREADDRFGRCDLLAQILAQRFIVALRAPVRRAVVAIEEIPLALQVLEYAQIVVAVFPGVRDEDPDWIALRHPRESRTSALVPKLARRQPPPLPQGTAPRGSMRTPRRRSCHG